jgi:outer membrane protein TolC
MAQTPELSLEQAIKNALDNNYGIKVQEKELEKSVINNHWGNTGALPSIGFTGSGSASYNANSTDNYTNLNGNASIKLDWIVFRGFSAKIMKSKLDQYQNMSEQGLALLVENMILSTTLTYYQALLSHENMSTAKKLMDLSYDRYKTEEERKKLGTSTTYNLLQTKNSYLENKTNYMTARTNFNNAIRQLNYVMAAPQNNKYELSTGFEATMEDFAYMDLEAKMLSNNKSLKNQYINLELARLDIKSAKSGYYPTVSTSASGGYSSTKTEYEKNTNMNQDLSGFTTSISAALSYNIYNGGQVKRDIQIAQIENEIAQINIQDMEADLKNQLAQEFELYEVRKQLLEVADENLKAAELNLELSTKKFENGLINSFNYRDIQQMYQSASINQSNAIFNVIQSYNTLLQLTGGIIEAQ